MASSDASAVEGIVAEADLTSIAGLAYICGDGDGCQCSAQVWTVAKRW